MALPLARDGAAELVLDLAAAFVELADQHQDRLHDVERLEAGDRDRAAVVAGEALVGGGADDRADMAGADEAIDADGAGCRDLRAVEDGLDGRRRQDVVAEDAEVAEAELGRLLDRHGGGRRRRLEADGEEDDFAVGVLLGEAQRVGAAVDHADVGALGAGLHQAGAVAARHPHHVAIGAQDDFRTAGEFDRHVEPADRQHADRAAGAVDHIDVGRQQVFDAVAADGVGVAAAELHDGVAAGGIGLRRDGGGDPGRQGAVAVLIDVFHAAAPASRIVSSASVRSASAGSSFDRA